jgi:acetaldehyde dehydrogenase
MSGSEPLNLEPSNVGPLNVAVLGTGIIGMDLVAKIKRSAVLECGLVAGRNKRSQGLRYAAELGCATTADGIDALVGAPSPFDVVFDATNAVSHPEHWKRLQPLGTLVIDLTPSRVGHMVVPTVNGTEASAHGDISLISCGGQASIPILHALTRSAPAEYIEVVTTAASSIVGRATRLNLDEYIETTQDAVRTFTGTPDVKAIFNISPAQPPATFRTAMSVLSPGAAAGPTRALVLSAAERVRAFAPGYTVTACDVSAERVFVSVEVTARSDLMPIYAGNLDIIDSAAVLIAEHHAAGRRSTAGVARTGTSGMTGTRGMTGTVEASR